MNRSSAFRLAFFSLLLGISTAAQAQFFNYLPTAGNYFTGNVTREPGGFLFSFAYQDTTLQMHRVLMFTDENGNLTETKKGNPYYASHVYAPDSSVIYSGRITVNAQSRALLQRNDKNGNVRWTRSLAGSSTRAITSVFPARPDLFYVTAYSTSFFNSTTFYKASVMAVDSSGQLLWTRYYSNAGLTTDYYFARGTVAANGDFIGLADVRGSMNASANGMVLTRIDPQGNVLFSKYIDFLPTHNQLGVTGLTEMPSGDIIIGGRLMTDQISIYPNTMWAARFNSSGDVQQQRIYSGGPDVGELLHSMREYNGKLYAYLHISSPFETQRGGIWIAELDPQTLAVSDYSATELTVTFGDPYGQVSNAFELSSNGKPTIASGFYCEEKGRYFPFMMQLDAGLGSDCPVREYSFPLLDSAATYSVTNYTPAGSFSSTFSADTARIYLQTAVPLPIAPLCNGCGSTAPVGLAEDAGAAQLHIFPNPAINMLNVKQAVPGIVKVYSVTGQLLFDQYVPESFSLDVAAYPPGIYVLKAGTQALTFIKQ